MSAKKPAKKTPSTRAKNPPGASKSASPSPNASASASPLSPPDTAIESSSLRDAWEGRLSLDLPTILVRFDQIRLDKAFNSRKDYRGIEALSQDISESGLISPLVVYVDPKQPAEEPEQYLVAAGFRRFLAITRLREEATKAGTPLPFDEIEVKLYKGSELGRWILNLRENMSRVDLHPWEIGDQCVKIRERFQLSGAQIGERLSYQKSHVNNCMRIVERVAKDVQDEFRAGKADPPFSFLITLAAMNLADGKPDHERQRQKWQEYIGAKSADPNAVSESGDEEDVGGRGAKMRRLREAERCLAKLEEGLKNATREDEREYFRGAIGAAKWLMGMTEKIKRVSFAKKAD